MGSFVFKWDHPASEVYVTGTFDDWSKSEKLIKTGDVFEKNVTLPSANDKIYYKFVVDGNWVTDHTAPQENDYSGNLNNVLTPDRIVKHKEETKHTPATAGIMSGVTPSSTTANLAKEAPLEREISGSSALPGSFPETPGLMEKSDFGVSPLPAFNGAVNPTSLPAGDKVPHHSELTGNSLTSGVTLDKDSYENSGGLGKASGESPLTHGSSTEKGEQAFSVNPLPAFAGGVNPISLPAGQTIPHVSHLTGNSIASGVTYDKEAYENSGGLGKAPVLPPVVTPQSEREHNGTGILGMPPISKNMIPESSLPMGTSGEGLYDASPMMQSSGPMSTTALLAGAVPLESSKVPAIVKQSQKEAGVDAEASAIPSEVNEKSALEKELLEEVPVAPSTSEGTAGKGTDKSEKTVTAGEVAAALGGAAVAVGGAAYAYAAKGAGAISQQLPSAETVQKSVSDSYNQLPSAATVQKSVSDSATSVSNSLPSTADVQKSVSTGASTVTSKLPTSVQDSIASMNSESVTHSTAKDTPLIVKESIAESGLSPEAAGNEEAVLEKKAVEKELLSEIKRETSTGESAPSAMASSAFATTAKDTPSVVKESIAQSGLSPEAAGNKEAVLEKKAVEKELLSEIKRETSAGESAPTITSAEKKITNAEPESPFVAPIADKSIPQTSAASGSIGQTSAPFVAPVSETSKPFDAAPISSAPVSSNPVDFPASSIAPIAEKKVETPATLAAPVVQRPIESRDVSPGTVPGSHTQAAAIAPSTPAKTTAPASSSSAPTSSSPAASSVTDKKKKRTSFFGKLKEKLSHKDKH